jgi:hypothetical protein
MAVGRGYAQDFASNTPIGRSNIDVAKRAREKAHRREVAAERVETRSIDAGIDLFPSLFPNSSRQSDATILERGR